MTRRQRVDDWLWAGPWLIIGLGILLMGVATYHFLREIRELGMVLFPFSAFVLNIGLAGGLTYTGWWARSLDLQPADRWRIVVWCFGGAALLGLVSFVTIGIRVLEGRIVGEAMFDILVSISTGGIAGFLIGLNTVRANREAQEAQQARETLAFVNRTLRHELLNGTNVILGQANSCTDLVNGEERDRLGVIISRCKDLADLIQTLRPAAEAFADDDTLHPVNLSEILEQRIDTIETTYPNAEFSATIPAGIHVRGNEALRHIFDNLLANAVEHNDSATPHVTVDVDLTDEHVHVTVADNGPGISDDRKSEIFEMKPQTEHGFGLYLVQTLVTRYGGDVWVEDNDPRGTVVHVELPRIAPGPQSERQIAPS